MKGLSKNEISSYCGNVLPLTFSGEGEVKWSCDSDIVGVRTFSEGELAFTNGILLTLKQVGEATVIAECDGVSYPCKIHIREMKHWSNEEACNYYAGDFHDHTTDEHNHDKFAVRDSGFPKDVINSVKEDGKMDFHVISDHTKTLNQRDFFRGFTDDELIEKEHIVFPGSESEVTVVEEDRYGIPCKRSGEIVVVNADNYSYAYSWEEFFDDYKDSPFAVAVLAHPQVSGFSVKGIWNFSLDKNNSPRMRELVKGIEMGDGGDRESNMINEYVYSKALDNGFHVSTTCSSDSHGNFGWKYDNFPGKTIIMAAEKSKEAFLDALNNQRFYACSSGNLKLKCFVNGKMAPCTLDITDSYDFKVDIDYFKEDASTVPVKCSIISDRGKELGVIEDEDLSHMEFTLETDEASYFYLRLVDSEGRKTWSPPIWTGRAPKKYTYPEKPLQKDGWTVKEMYSENDASVLVCDDPRKTWSGKGYTASLIIDMKEVKTVSAIGHYAPFVDRLEYVKQGISQSVVMGTMAAQYEIYTSLDGVVFEFRDEGFVRIYGGEEILPFDPVEARYIRFDVLSTVGKATDRKELPHSPVTIAELSVY
ncbi:MAG: discoidin domain-containing protein [Ruminococcaceae bacterium]|nr:discoidin domain-containing protein [Oscillospiraceae bacterium]